MYTAGIEQAPCIDCKVPTDVTVKNPAPICPKCLLQRGGKLYKKKLLGDGTLRRADGNQTTIFVN